MAQVRAGVRLRKALCAVMSHPSVAHRFEPVGVVILEVRMARDFKLAHVRYVVADDAPDDNFAIDDFSDDARRLHLRRKAAAILRANAAKLRNMAGKMLRAKHTPRLEFVDDEEVTREERALNAAFRRVEEEEKAREARRREEEEEEAAAEGYEPELVADDGEAREPNRREEEEEATAMGYAFETYDGGPNYRSDFDPAFDERVDRLFAADDADAAEEGSGGVTAPSSSPGLAGRRGARRARALAAGGLLLDEAGDVGDEGEEEGLDDAAWAAFLEEDDGLEEEEEEDDDDEDAFDEFVDGDEFDEFEEEDEEEEEEDFDFEKFDRVEERRRERGGGR